MHIQLIEDFLSAALEHFSDTPLEEVSTLDMIDCLAVAGLTIVPDFQGKMSELYINTLKEQVAAK